MRFSSRQNFVQQRVQNGNMSDGFRRALWNTLTLSIDEVHKLLGDIKFVFQILSHLRAFLKPSKSSATADTKGGDVQAIKRYFFSCEWYDVYNMLEYTYTLIPSAWFVERCNEVFAEHASTYRFLKGKIVPIHSKTDMLAIETALNEIGTENSKIAQRHLETAFHLLAEKQAPDYEMVIRMSIKAVEAICIEIVDAPKANLDETFKKLSAENRQLKMPRQLKAAFKKLYGYTSDDGSIHSPLLDAANPDVEDAVFMLVACSGFVSYLIAKASKAGINLM